MKNERTTICSSCALAVNTINGLYCAKKKERVEYSRIQDCDDHIFKQPKTQSKKK